MMSDAQDTYRAKLIAERNKTISLLTNLERQLKEYEERNRDLVLELAEAEERGHWATAAELRTVMAPGRRSTVDRS